MDVATATLTLLPPERLGHLLREGRTSRGRSLTDLAAASVFSVDELVALERGELRFADDQIGDVLAAYGMAPAELLPARSQVVVDLDQRQLLVAEEAATLGSEAPTADEVLSAYLSLVYTLRNATPGTPVVLRQYDVAVLARTLRLAEPDVETRLVGLMAEPTPELGRLHRLLRAKYMVPVVGAVIVVAVTGTVLVLRSDEPPTMTRSSISTPPPIEAPLDTGASLIPPQQQERTSDGSPGPVQEIDP